MSETKHRGRPSVHPWDKWLSNKEITLNKGKDYTCEQHSMCVLIRITAAKRNLKLGVYTKKDGSIHVVNKSYE